MMSMNWLDDTPVFAGQKLVVVGGSSGMGRQAAADVVAAGGSAVIIGEDAGKVDDTVQTLAKEGSAARAPSATWPTPSRSCFPRRPAGSPAPSGTSTAASWPAATNPRPPVRRPSHPAHGPPPTATAARQTPATTPHGGHHDGPAGKAAGSWGVGVAG